MSKLENTMQAAFSSSFLSANSVSYIETLYETYLSAPEQITEEWRAYFDNLPKLQASNTGEVSHAHVRNQFYELAKHSRKLAVSMSNTKQSTNKHTQVAQLINAYRSHGHTLAKLDPLNLKEKKPLSSLSLSTYGLTHDDLDEVSAANGFIGLSQTNLREIYQALNETYCGYIGIEYMYITNPEELDWIQQQIEPVRARGTFSTEEKINILTGLTAAEGLEKYLGNRYIGQKRFSLEGAESLIPMLDSLVQRAGSRGIKEIVLGMAHRGRLNVLVNTFGKAPEALFNEFEGINHNISASGDVKYHLGFSSDIKTPGGPLHLVMAFNPSHLEIINPVVEGSVRARQQRRGDEERSQVLPVLIHGDAAFAGQGVIMETLNLSQTRGFSTGGTVHIIINNQIGFTISNPKDARSTPYCTDIAKMLEAPVLHVNADHPESVVFAMQIALDYRLRFKKDVVIDLVCYRRLGHNEADEPAATQPVMYHKIKQHPTVTKLYAEELVKANIISIKDAQAITERYRQRLEAGQPVVSELLTKVDNPYAVNWSPYLNKDWREIVKTGLDKKELYKLGQQITVLPEGFSLQPQVTKMLENRRKMVNGELFLDWGCAENFAYASLLKEGYSVRLCGQDSGRGTFAHRHAVFHDYLNGSTYIPLQHISDEQGNFEVIDSLLSEEAVVGFEYGYASAEPNTLVLWEAQFGDFANGAQVLIDQFISSGEQKWGRLCGLVMLLPHGYEGMGPEHSSARLERYLQLCAQENMQVCVPTTPAQVFHMLRRQMIRPFRKPLIVMSPKSLLRHKLAASPLEELMMGKFQLLIGEIDEIKPAQVKRVIFCCGKVYYDLLEKRRADQREDVAIIRIEQLYPFPKAEFAAELAHYKHVQEVVWCQEEPLNQGAWLLIQEQLKASLQNNQQLIYAGREDSASPAVGYSALHKEQQDSLVKEALGN